MPLANSGRSAGTKFKLAWACSVFALACSSTSPASDGDSNSTHSCPPSTNTCTPGSSRSRSRTFQRPRLLCKVTGVGVVTRTLAASSVSINTLTALLPSAGNAWAGEVMRSFAKLPGAMTFSLMVCGAAFDAGSVCVRLKTFTPACRFRPTYSTTCKSCASKLRAEPTRDASTTTSFKRSCSVAPRFALTSTLVCA